MPDAASTQYDTRDPDSTRLQRLAQRIARNQEVLGLHYRSDSTAGQELADKSFEILMECPTILDIIEKATIEWDEYHC
jgi:hypothetical protein